MRRPPETVPGVLSTLPAGVPPRAPKLPRRPLPRRSEEMSGELGFREYSLSASPHNQIWKHLADLLMQIRWNSVIRPVEYRTMTDTLRFPRHGNPNGRFSNR